MNGGAQGAGAGLPLLLALLAALLAVRIAGAFVPNMWAWGTDLLRFVPPPIGWPIVAVAALAWIPALSRRLESALTPLLAGKRGPDWRTYLLWGALAAAVVTLLPDQLLFVGDARLRRDMLNAPGGEFAALNPQALVLDGWLHDSLTRQFAAALGMGANAIARMLGTFEAAVMGALAVHLARVLGLRGGAALAATAVFLCSGALALFTGYTKAFSELALVTAAVGVFGLEVLRSRRGFLPLGIALALGLFLHRLALGLVPACALAWFLSSRSAIPGERRLGFTGWLALAIPLAALGLTAPGLVRLLISFDPENFRAPGAPGAAGLLAAAFTPAQLADSAAMILLMAPLAPVALLAPFALSRPGRGRELALLATLTLPLVGFLPLFHPPIGLFRNWDAFAPAGVALSLAAAWTVGSLLGDRPRAAGLGSCIALQAAAPALLWLIHQHDLDRGLARVEAYLREPPERTVIERASAWDFLGARYVDLGRVDASAAAFANAAALTPSPRILREWAMLETLRGDTLAARGALRTLLERKPDELRAWMEAASLAWLQGDTADARRSANAALRLSPGLPAARVLLERIDALHSGSAR